jgi:hypothetical protein
MRSRLRICGVMSLYAVLGLLSVRVQADSWYAESGLVSYYGKEFQGKKLLVANAFRRPR